MWLRKSMEVDDPSLFPWREAQLSLGNIPLHSLWVKGHVWLRSRKEEAALFSGTGPSEDFYECLSIFCGFPTIRLFLYYYYNSALKVIQFCQTNTGRNQSPKRPLRNKNYLHVYYSNMKSVHSCSGWNRNLQ